MEEKRRRAAALQEIPGCSGVAMAPWFSVSVADKGLSVAVSGLESTVTGGCVSVDSSRLTAREGAEV